MDWQELVRHAENHARQIGQPTTVVVASMVEKAHDAEVERVTAEFRDRLKGALIPAEVFGPDDICPRCSGWGFRAYPNTTTWLGGIGGQAITNGVCDVCWGSGQKSRKGADLRQLYVERKSMKSEVAQLQARVERLEESMRHITRIIALCGRDYATAIANVRLELKRHHLVADAAEEE